MIAAKFGKKLRGLDAEVLLNTVANSLANVNEEKLSARLSAVSAKVLVAVLVTQ